MDLIISCVVSYCGYCLRPQIDHCQWNFVQLDVPVTDFWRLYQWEIATVTKSESDFDGCLRSYYLNDENTNDHKGWMSDVKIVRMVCCYDVLCRS